MFFGNGGGFPFPPQQRGPIENERLYKTLGLTKGATEVEIKKAYRKLVLVHHPDKAHKDGCPEKFKDIASAYEVLSDPERKRTYDMHGEAAANSSGPSQSNGGVNPADLFNMFFSGGQNGRKVKGEDIVHPLRISMEDLYKGKTFKLSINRDIICEACNGVGGPPDALVSCPGCLGKGFQVAYRQIAPGMMQKLQSQCPVCKGQCKIMASDKLCTSCKGGKTTKENKVLSVVVPPGTEDNHRFVFSGGSDCAPGVPPGDVIFVVQTIEHKIFKRKDDDLLMDYTLSITQALCGFDICIANIDGTSIRLVSQANEVTKPETLHMISEAGMPTKIGGRGRLFVHFHITFPDRLSNIEELRECLPPAPERVVRPDEVVRQSIKVKAQPREAGGAGCSQM
jgi:DnaJ homolog subfamily A member 2